MNCPSCGLPMTKLNYYATTEKWLCSSCTIIITGELTEHDRDWVPLFEILDERHNKKKA